MAWTRTGLAVALAWAGRWILLLRRLAVTIDPYRQP